MYLHRLTVSVQIGLKGRILFVAQGEAEPIPGSIGSPPTFPPALFCWMSELENQSRDF